MTSELGEGCSPNWGLMSESPPSPDNRKRRTRKPRQTFRRENCDVDDVISEVIDYDKIQAFLTPNEQSVDPTSAFINPSSPNLIVSRSDQRQSCNNLNNYFTKSVGEPMSKSFEKSMKLNGRKKQILERSLGSLDDEKIHKDWERLRQGDSEKLEFWSTGIVGPELISDSNIKVSEDLSPEGYVNVNNRLDRQCKRSYPVSSNDLDESDDSFEMGLEDDTDGNYEGEEWPVNYSYAKKMSADDADTITPETAGTGSDDTQLSCKLCNVQFTCRSKLRTHMKKHAIRTISCSECQIFFTSQGALLWHARFVHTTRKYDHECEVCGVTVRLKQDLMSHYMTHRLAKGVARCLDCSRSFKNTVLLKLHQLTMCTKNPE